MGLLDFCKNSEEIYIYGAGKLGQKLCNSLRALGVVIHGFLVSIATGQMNIDKFPVYSFVEWDEKRQNSRAGIILAISDCCSKEKIFNNLLNKNYKNIFLVDNEVLLDLYRRAHPVCVSNFLENNKPVSCVFGCDRGTPIDRYYIEKFLKVEVGKIDGISRTLEVGDDAYSKKYACGTKHDVLRYDMGMDLTNPKSLPGSNYDLFICTQVFNFIYDVKDAVFGSYFLLKEGGILLATVAGNISQVSRFDMDRWGHFWGFTYLGIERMVCEIFGKDNVKIVPFGNCMAATAFIQGVSLEDLPDRNLLEYKDPDYAIVIGIVAKKAAKDRGDIR